MAQDDRCGFEIVDDFPFMLRHSKHSEFFFSNLLRRGLCCASKEMIGTKFIIKMSEAFVLL